jgi:hypothetical protein
MKIGSVGAKPRNFPDVCVTPTPAGPVPIPYPNVKTGDGPSVAKTKMQTKGLSGPGAEALAKGKPPDGANDRLRFTNASKSAKAATAASVRPAMLMMAKSAAPRPPGPKF